MSGAKDGDKVVVRLTDFGGERKKPEGAVIEILGPMDDPATDVTSIIRAYGIEQEFPKSVMKDAYAHDFIHDESIWVDMLNDRNQTSHIYQDEIAQQIFERIVNRYVNELKELALFMKKA